MGKLSVKESGRRRPFCVARNMQCVEVFVKVGEVYHVGSPCKLVEHLLHQFNTFFGCFTKQREGCLMDVLVPHLSLLPEGAYGGDSHPCR